MAVASANAGTPGRSLGGRRQDGADGLVGDAEPRGQRAKTAPASQCPHLGFLLRRELARPAPIASRSRTTWYRPSTGRGLDRRVTNGKKNPPGLPQPSGGTGGSDGDRLREIDVVGPPLVPFLYPERALRARRRRGAGRYAAGAKPPRIPEDRWPEVVARARREGLRAVARDLGVSHETVRSVLRAVDQAGASA